MTTETTETTDERPATIDTRTHCAECGETYLGCACYDARPDPLDAEVCS